MFDSFSATRTEVDRFNLLNHNKARQLTVFRNRHVKGETTLCVCNWTYNSQACAAVEQVLANNKSRATSFLFMTGLWIESDCDDITLLGDISSHLPGLLTDRLTPVNFAGLVVFRNTRHKILKIVPPTFLFCW